MPMVGRNPRDPSLKSATFIGLEAYSIYIVAVSFFLAAAGSVLNLSLLFFFQIVN
jgi:hypothetical protein